MATVRRLLVEKGDQVWTILPEATVLEALKVMANKNVGVLVVSEAGRLVGVVSERDYARKVALEGRSAEDTPVKDIMTRRVIFVHPDTTLEYCMELMTDHHIRHLPVVEDDRLIGIISIGDVVKEIISAQRWTIQSLEHYYYSKKETP